MNALPLLLVGGAALLLTGKKKGSATATASSVDPGKAYPDPAVANQEAQASLKKLLSATGNPDFDTSLRPIDTIVLEVQLYLDVEPADGRWSVQTQRAIDNFIASEQGRS